jgi:hypothetical protein
MWIELFNFLTDLWYKNNDIKKADRIRLSELFLEISNLIKDVHINLINDTFPTDSCNVLNVLSENLFDTLSNYLDKDKSAELTNMLLNCVNIERFYNERNDPKVFYYLADSSSHFKALNILYKV